MLQKAITHLSPKEIRDLGEKAREIARERKKNAVELYCDLCGAHIGYAFENDLKGSYFYCGDCIE